MDLSDQRRAFSSILGRELANRMLEPEQMGAQTGIEAGRLRDFLDASAFPEALGVNPQITIASLAIEGADRIISGETG